MPSAPVVKAFDYDVATDTLKILDQKQLPSKIVFYTITSTDESRDHIANMTVRGAPCIAAVYILSMVAELNHSSSILTDQDLLEYHRTCYEKIFHVRRTAVNLYNAMERLKSYITDVLATRSIPFEQKKKELTFFCVDSIRLGVEYNQLIGDVGCEKLIANLSPDVKSNGLTILTHCNTGSLATTGYGTALGVIRSLHKRGALKHVYCTETRPYNQGSRLTAWELVQENIPATLIVDSAVAFLMLKHPIDAVIVGADCVTKNGDTANKIGTLQLAIMAKSRNIPFYVAAPLQTIDLERENGEFITVECRPADEVRMMCDTMLAPSEIEVWNPSFDITPSDLITGIMTECGVFGPKHVKELGPKKLMFNSSLY